MVSCVICCSSWLCKLLTLFSWRAPWELYKYLCFLSELTSWLISFKHTFVPAIHKFIHILYAYLFNYMLIHQCQCAWKCNPLPEFLIFISSCLLRILFGSLLDVLNITHTASGITDNSPKPLFNSSIAISVNWEFMLPTSYVPNYPALIVLSFVRYPIDQELILCPNHFHYILAMLLATVASELTNPCHLLFPSTLFSTQWIQGSS